MKYPFAFVSLPCQGTAPKGGLIAVCGEPIQGDTWWFVHTDGLYVSTDVGTTLTKFLDAAGTSMR